MLNLLIFHYSHRDIISKVYYVIIKKILPEDNQDTIYYRSYDTTIHVCMHKDNTIYNWYIVITTISIITCACYKIKHIVCSTCLTIVPYILLGTVYSIL